MISEISLENFKCFNNQSVSLSNINILTGANGRGKSSVIQSILLIAQSYSKNGGLMDLEISGGEYISLGGFDDILKKGGSSDCFGIGIKSTDSKENDVKITFKKNAFRSEIAELSSFKINGEEKMVMMSDASENNSDEVSTIITVVTSAISALQYFDKVCYVSADRHAPESRTARRMVSRLDPHGYDLLNFLSARKDLLKTIIDDASEILSGASLEINDTDALVSILMDSVDGSKGFLPINVGYGYGYVLPLLAMLSYIPDESILLIENPEAHLHPRAVSRLMRKMIEYASRRNLQVIMETHSDHIVNGAMVAVKEKVLTPDNLSIYYFERDPDDDKSCRGNRLEVRPDGRIMNQPKGFFDQIDEDLERILGF